MFKTFLFVSSFFLSGQLFGQEWMSSMENNPNPNFYQIRDDFNNYWAGKTIEKGKGYKVFKRWEWYWETRVNPDGTFPNPAQITGGLDEFKQMSNFAGRGLAANWISMGPTSSPGGYAGLGRVNAIAFDPGNSNIIWIGAPSGGLWKTTDGGTNWSTGTDNFSVLGVSGIVITPSNSNIMYVATGDGDAGDTRSIGVLKSTDGGATWNPTGLTFTLNSFITIRKLLIDPNDENQLIAATSNGLYRTINAGTTWTQVQTGNFYDVEAQPGAASDNFYASIGNQIYRSTNNGATWTSVQTITGANRIALAVSNADNTIVVALCSNASGSGFLGLYRSANSGASYTLQSNSPNLLGYAVDGSDVNGQGWYDLIVTLDPTNANIVYVGGVNVWKSTNAGVTWTLNTFWYNQPPFAEVHADKHVFEWQNNTTLFQGNDGGIYRTANGGSTWTDKSGNLGISQLYRLGVSQTSNAVIAGLQDNGTKLRSNAGTWSDVIGGDGMECIIDYSNAQYMYGELYYGDIYRSSNTGASFPTNISNNIPGGMPSGGAWITPVILSPTTPTTIYAGYRDVYKSLNRGDTWTKISTNLSPSTSLQTLAEAPSNANTLYAATFSNLYRTINGGTTWNTMTTPAGAGSMTYLIVHPTNANTLYVTMSNYTAGNKVYKSTDGGATWSNISGSLPNLPANCIVYQNGTADGLYVGMDVGVFYRDNTLPDWVVYNTGLPNVIINELEIKYNTTKLRAATYGRGLWESDLYSAAPQCTPPTVNAPTVTQPTCPVPSGTIVVNATGSGPLEYSLNGGPWQSSATFSSLGGGNYNILVRLQSDVNCFNSYTNNPVVINPPPVGPTAFTMTGGGAYCTGGPGAVMGLSGSETGVNYQLRLNLVNTGPPIGGNGTPISFGPQTGMGSYTVLATNATTLCTSVMTGALTVSTFNCTVEISDPCVCKNNATTLENGQFDETIKVNAPGTQIWTVVLATGLYSPSSLAPPNPPIPITNGTVLTNLGAAMNMFELKGVHVDAQGYSVTVTNNAGTILTIGNACSYPNPSFSIDLSANFCLFSDPVDLAAGTPGDANIVSQSFTVNGVPATQFNPAQGVGTYIIEYIVDGGVPKAFGPNDPGCIQKVSAIAHVIATPAVLNCNDQIYVSLPASCTGEIMPDDVLEGTYGCFDDYQVELDRTLPLGNGPWTSGLIDAADIGQTYQARVTHKVSGNKCWGLVTIQDKLAPAMTCQDIHLICPITTYDPGYLLNVLGIATAYPTITDCSNFTSSYIDNWVDLPCTGSINGQNNISAYVLRKWTATDAWGNSTTCNQYLYFDRKHIADVQFPAEFSIQCTANVNTDPSVTGAPYLTAFGKQWPLYPGGGFCEMQAAYVDQILPVCDGTYKILRTWTVLDWCLPTSANPPFNPIHYIQLIKVLDETGPAFTCPPNTTVSIDPFACCATVDMPDRIIEDACSRVNKIEGMVVTFDQYTGDQTGMYTFGGALTDFPGNNYWDRDTLGQWGTTPCLPIGTHTVTYRAQDDCGNVKTCTFRLAVQDLIPPVAACDQVTKVALGSDGKSIINAETFDDGSYDLCCLKDFKVGRGNNLGPTVSFDCGDIGHTVNVTFRVTDCSGNTNDCMVEVLVEDKLKPICSPPANVTVTCEQFDPSLWLYGKADLLDNCCLDATKVYQGQKGLTHSVSYSQFDTLCNKGTIVRTFRAFDCNGNSSQCTQRIVVTYEQDYYVRFPNDVIITVCDGTGNYGEPTFFGKDCELLGVTYEDAIFTVVPDACYKIERNWKIINWCTYNPNAGCINVPNPTPNAISNNPANLPGPIVSPIQTTGDPWKSTIVKINSTDAQATNYSIYYDPNANCYTYKQIIKIIDNQAPTTECPASPVTVCDLTPNDAQLWNQSYWWDNHNQSHDLCEAPSDICLTATDACSGSNINIEYQLFLDLDGDGVMETVVNSTMLGNQVGGLGWNNILFGNVSGVGQPRQFDGRPVPTNQKWGFAIQETVTGNKKTACVKFNTFQAQGTFVTPQLPYGTHKIKWFVSDGCGNDAVCEYTIIVKDCKAPTVVCLNGLSVNLMPTGMIQLWATDFLQYAEDNCTLNPYLKYGIRTCGSGTGFPVDAQGNPITNLTFDCLKLGANCVELWAIDLAGNADYCETYVIVQDNAGNCGTTGGSVAVSGALKTEATDGVEGVTVTIAGTNSAALPFSFSGLSNSQGLFSITNGILPGSSLSVIPELDKNPLNGVTTYDLVLISKHILGIEPLNTPYKMIAADANKSNSITTFDVVEFRKLVLGIYQELPNNSSWRFIDKAFVFTNPNNPFQTAFPEQIDINAILNNQLANDFVGVKIGDVNNTVVANTLMNSDDRAVGTLLLDLNDRSVKAGEEFELTFKTADKVQGFQTTLNLNGLTVSEIVGSDNVTTNNFGVFADALTVSIDGADAFTVKFRAAKSGKLSEMLAVSSRITKSEAYNLADGRLDVALRFDGKTIAGVGFELYQNQPNPFVNKTYIGFNLPEEAAATLTVYDETGRVVFKQKGDYAKGYNAISLDRALLNTAGVLYYTLETATDSATRKMIQAR